MPDEFSARSPITLNYRQEEQIELAKAENVVHADDDDNNNNNDDDDGDDDNNEGDVDKSVRE